MDETKLVRLRALNRFNQELYAEIQPKLKGAKYYHSETEFWSPLIGGISILRTRINAYEFPPFDCQDMSARLWEPDCQEILELQQVELGRISEDLTENAAKIEEAVKAAVGKGKRFSLQANMDRVFDQNLPIDTEATEEEWETAEKIIGECQFYKIPCVSIRTAKTKEAMVIDEFE